MMTLHHLNNSRSQRVLWLLEELGVAYEIQHYQRDRKTNLAPESLKQVHPLGKSPVITNGEDIVAESGAIIEYLCDRFATEQSHIVTPTKGTPEAIQFNYWMHFAEGTAMTQLLIKGMFDRVKVAPMPFFIKPIARKIADSAIAAYAGPNVKANTQFIENHLAKNEWFCGAQMTGADFQMSFPLEVIIAREGGKSMPNISAFVKRIQARPAYQRALEAGGTYAYV
jgi:glutathione S-transferase